MVTINTNNNLIFTIPFLDNEHIFYIQKNNRKVTLLNMWLEKFNEWVELLIKLKKHMQKRDSRPCTRIFITGFMLKNYVTLLSKRNWRDVHLIFDTAVDWTNWYFSSRSWKRCSGILSTWHGFVWWNAK